MSPRAAAVLEAAVAVAREHGVACEQARVVRDAGSILVHLAPAPVLARASTLDLGVPAGVQLALAAHAAAAGAPVVAPALELPAVPHRRDGLELTFWRFVEHDPERPLDPAEAARALRALHGALAGCTLPLPPYHRLETVAALLERLEPDELVPAADLQALRAARDIVAATLPAAVELRALHGDAHLGNVLRTASGPLWSDLEHACRGPVEYDLACLRWRERVHGRPQSGAADEYGPHDRDLVEALFPALGVFLATVTVGFVRRFPTPSARRMLRERLDYAASLAG